MYFDTSDQIFCDHGEIQIIHSETGFHQGDVLGSWGFMLTIQRLLERLDSHISEMFPEGGDSAFSRKDLLTLFYVDDGYLCGPPEMVKVAIQFLRRYGPNYGYVLNELKGVLKIGECDTIDDALIRVQGYVAVEAIQANSSILLHPNNVNQAKMDDRVDELPPMYIDAFQSEHFEPGDVYGMKVLGSFIGSDEYVTLQLEAVVTEWGRIKQELIDFPHVQQRMLLFRKCFSQKPVHLIRTITARLTSNLVDNFVAMQMEILESMFSQKIPHVYMDFFCLPIRNGGLGLLNHNTISSIAHIASVCGLATFRNAFIDQAENAIEGGNDLITTFGAFGADIVQRLQALKGILDLGEDATLVRIIQKIDELNLEAMKNKTTLQRLLYTRVEKHKIKDLEQIMADEDASLLKFFNWKQIANKSAGMWLDCWCTQEEFTMDNKEFGTALCLRYQMQIPYIDSELKSCACCGKGTKLDPFGHHYISGCKRDIRSGNGFNQGAQIHAIHDQLRYVLYRATKHANTRSIQEPVQLLYVPNAVSQVRPDLHVKFAPINTTEPRDYAIDLTIVCPFHGSESGILSTGYSNLTYDKVELKHINSRAIASKKTKIAKYGPICKNHTKEIKFVPFVVNTTGQIHSEGIAFLRKLAIHAAETRYAADENVFFNYYLKKMSVGLMKLVANTIYAKAVNHFARTINNPKNHLRDGNRDAYLQNVVHPFSHLYINKGD